MVNACGHHGKLPKWENHTITGHFCVVCYERTDYNMDDYQEVEAFQHMLAGIRALRAGYVERLEVHKLNPAYLAKIRNRVTQLQADELRLLEWRESDAT